MDLGRARGHSFGNLSPGARDTRSNSVISSNHTNDDDDDDDDDRLTHSEDGTAATDAELDASMTVTKQLTAEELLFLAHIDELRQDLDRQLDTERLCRDVVIEVCEQTLAVASQHEFARAAACEVADDVCETLEFFVEYLMCPSADDGRIREEAWADHAVCAHFDPMAGGGGGGDGYENALVSTPTPTPTPQHRRRSRQRRRPTPDAISRTASSVVAHPSSPATPQPTQQHPKSDKPPPPPRSRPSSKPHQQQPRSASSATGTTTAKPTVGASGIFTADDDDVSWTVQQPPQQHPTRSVVAVDDEANEEYDEEYDEEEEDEIDELTHGMFTGMDSEAWCRGVMDATVVEKKPKNSQHEIEQDHTKFIAEFLRKRRKKEAEAAAAAAAATAEEEEEHGQHRHHEAHDGGGGGCGASSAGATAGGKFQKHKRPPPDPRTVAAEQARAREAQLERIDPARLLAERIRVICETENDPHVRETKLRDLHRRRNQLSTAQMQQGMSKFFAAQPLSPAAAAGAAGAVGAAGAAGGGGGTATSPKTRLPSSSSVSKPSKLSTPATIVDTTKKKKKTTGLRGGDDTADFATGGGGDSPASPLLIGDGPSTHVVAPRQKLAAMDHDRMAQSLLLLTDAGVAEKARKMKKHKEHAMAHLLLEWTDDAKASAGDDEFGKRSGAAAAAAASSPAKLLSDSVRKNISHAADSDGDQSDSAGESTFHGSSGGKKRKPPAHENPDRDLSSTTHGRLIVDSRLGVAVRVSRDLLHEGELPPQERMRRDAARTKFMTKQQQQKMVDEDPLRPSVVQVRPHVRVHQNEADKRVARQQHLRLKQQQQQQQQQEKEQQQRPPALTPPPPQLSSSFGGSGGKSVSIRAVQPGSPTAASPTSPATPLAATNAAQRRRAALDYAQNATQQHMRFTQERERSAIAARQRGYESLFVERPAGPPMIVPQAVRTLDGVKVTMENPVDEM